MKTVFTSPSLIDAYKAKSLLEEADIKCALANENVSFLAGEVPFAATWPQVDVLDDADFNKASEILKAMEIVEVKGKSWTCSSCEEIHEPQFEVCWNCGNVKS